MLKKICLVLSVMVLLIASMVNTVGAEAFYKAEVSGLYRNDLAYEQLKLINEARKDEGLKPLTYNMALFDTAKQRAAEIVAYVSHTRPNGESYDTLNTAGGWVGENIAYYFSTAEEVTDFWMNSSGHRANILSKNYKSIAISCLTYDGVNYWVEYFSTEESQKVDKLPSNTNETRDVEIGVGMFVWNEYYDICLNAGKTYVTNLSGTIDNPLFTLDIPTSGLTFRSNDTKVAKVNSKGVVYAIGDGEATIYIEGPNFTTSYNVHVSADYKIAYNVNGGKKHSYSPSGYTNPIKLRPAEKKGCLFKGWYTGEGYKKKVTNLYGGDKKLYARWIKLDAPEVGVEQTSITSSNKLKLVMEKADVDGYQVYISYDENFKNVKKSLTDSRTFYSSKLSKGKPVYYKVRSYLIDSTGSRIYSDFSETFEIK